MAEFKKRFKPKPDEKLGLAVDVPDGQFEKAFRKFRNKIQDSGILEEIKDRMEYEKPCVARKKAKSMARKRWLKKVASTQMPKKLYQEKIMGNRDKKKESKGRPKKDKLPK